jgi:hypothetical protein
MPITIQCVNEQTKERYKEAVLEWLREDYYNQGCPSQHFLCNSSVIINAFKQGNAMVALDRNEVIGFMIWSHHGSLSAEIDIVEVDKQYQRRGIFKKMLEKFSAIYPEIVLLSVSAIFKALSVFRNMGWQDTSSSYQGIRDTTPFMKIIKPVLEPLSELPSGQAIAICSEDHYYVSAAPDKFKAKMRYFAITLDDKANLAVPIAIDFHKDWYVGVYFNRKLIADGKARHLFKSGSFYANASHLTLGIISPTSATPFNEVGFFSLVNSKTEDAPLQKRRRVENKTSTTTAYSAGVSHTLLAPPRDIPLPAVLDPSHENTTKATLT